MEIVSAAPLRAVRTCSDTFALPDSPRPSYTDRLWVINDFNSSAMSIAANDELGLYWSTIKQIFRIRRFILDSADRKLMK
jgi:hypothetical protein